MTSNDDEIPTTITVGMTSNEEGLRMARIEERRHMPIVDHWADIEKSKTITVQFTWHSIPGIETPGGPYHMYITWNCPGGRYRDDRYYRRQGRKRLTPDGCDDTPGQFLPGLTKAASRAVKMLTLRVLYPDNDAEYEEYEDEWAYPTLSKIIPLFTGSRKMRATVRMDGENDYGFLVTFEKVDLAEGSSQGAAQGAADTFGGLSGFGADLLSPSQVFKCETFDVDIDFANIPLIQRMRTMKHIWSFGEINRLLENSDTAGLMGF